VDKWTTIAPYDFPNNVFFPVNDDIAIHPNNPNIWFMLASSNLYSVDTVYRSNNGGKSWYIVNEEAPWSARGADLSAIFIEPNNPTVLYILEKARSGNTLYKSTDEGIHWNPSTISIESLPDKQGELAHDQDGNTIYRVESGDALTASALRVGSRRITYPSIHTGSDYRTEIVGVYADRTQAGVIYIVVFSHYTGSTNYDALAEKAIIKSTDYGQTWEPPIMIKTPMPYGRKQEITNGSLSVKREKIDPFAKNIRYREDSSKLFKSIDNGINWQVVGAFPANKFILSSTIQNVLYSYDVDMSHPIQVKKGIHHSIDGGKIWTKIFKTETYTYKNGTDQPDPFLFLDEKNSRYYLFDGKCIESFFGICGKWADVQVVTSFDSGNTWENVGKLNDTLPNTTVSYQDVNQIVVNGTTQYAATDKGIYISQDSGTTWNQFDNNGLPFTDTEVTSVSFDPNNDKIIYAHTSVANFVYGKPSPASINSVEPTDKAHPAETVKFNIYGNYLTNDQLNISIDNCANVTQLSGGDDLTQHYECTMADVPAGDQAGKVLDVDGAVLSEFSLSVVPLVTAVTPSNVVGGANTFTVEGRGLPADMIFKLDECANVETVAENSSEASRQFSCGVTLAASGDLSGSLELATGEVFHTFSVTIGSPKVTSVSPDSAIIAQNTTFTVKGENLPEGLTFFVGFCGGTEAIAGGSPTERQFKCVFAPPRDAAPQELKINSPSNEVLFESTVTVLTPVITDISPLQAVLGAETTFTLKGESLPADLGFFLGFCADTVAIEGGNLTERQFKCVYAPAANDTTQAGHVADSRNEVFYTFSIEGVESLVTDLPKPDDKVALEGDRAQCATFSPPKSVHVPCLDVDGTIFSFNMDLLPEEEGVPLRLAVDSGSLTPTDLTPTGFCGKYDGASNVRLNCVDLGDLFSADLSLVPSLFGLQLELSGLDQH
jgi:hypothetical protein